MKLSQKARQNVVLAVVIVAAVLLLRMVLGSRELMYFTASRFETVTVETVPSAAVTLEDRQVGELAPMLSKIVFYRREEPSGETGRQLHLVATEPDGSQTDVVIWADGTHLTMDGKTFQVRAKDVENVIQWVDAQQPPAA